ncbi:hypothetical protein PM082_007977 [Marasmius tenuissimus]|nr:hypothetical protein PM082_007977 [Marasmius tenuissimus]
MSSDTQNAGHHHGHHGHHHHHHHEHQAALPENIQGDIAAANKAHFDAHAHSYDATPYILEVTKKVGAAIVEAVPFNKETTTVLEYACGTGLVSNELIQHAKSLVGVDISEGMITQFRNRFEKQGLPSDKVKGVCQELKGEDGELDGAKFDVVVCSMAYHHFDPSTLQRTTDILASVLKPGGYLAIVDNEPDAQGREMYQGVDKAALGHQTGFSREHMDRLFTGAGLSTRSYNHLTKFEVRGTEHSTFLATAQKPE